MRHLLNNPAIITTVIAASIWSVLVEFAPVDSLNYVLRVGIITVCIVTLIRWGRAAWVVYWEGAREPESAAILAVVLTAISYLWYAIWTWVSRALGAPDWMMDSPWSAFFAFLALISFVLAIASTRLAGERPSALVTFALASGTALGLAATAVGHLLVAKMGGLATVILRALWHL